MYKFKKICKKTQSQLKLYLVKQLKKYGYNVYESDGFLYAEGTLPILLTAHMDTVHKVQCTYIKETFINGAHQLSSFQGIGGDDRCGVYMILEIIKTHKCSVLFCEDEESGGIGSKKFCESEFIDNLNKMKYLIELDRMNATDAVFYQCDNPKFTEFITKNTGYKKAYGSFSDISTLAPKCKIAAVNLSCGYYKPHTTSEYVVWEEMLNTINVVKKLLDTDCESFEYIKSNYYYPSYPYYNNYYHYNTHDRHNNYGVLLKVQMQHTESSIKTHYSYGSSKDEAWGKFFLKNPHICFNDILCYDFDYT